MLTSNHRVYVTSSLNKKGLQKITILGEEQESSTGRIVKAAGELFMSILFITENCDLYNALLYCTIVRKAASPMQL